MITTKSKLVNSQLSTIFIHHLYISNNKKNTISSRSYHTRRPTTTTTSNPRHERPHKPTRNLLRKPIPFPNNIKEIQDPDEAFSLFEYHQMGFKHDYPSYSSLIYKLARARKFEAVETLLHYVQNYNIRCGETLFLALIKHYGKAKLVDKTI